ncbi:MAG: 16S rRNA (guanine(966)-N(2))-methyltransferase RsmD [Burkholderiaceae bacterium]|nr:16S rRNA (guanine(966)-N(2))-methyltransferase RsmD [Burkholderiaceae bacterium]
MVQKKKIPSKNLTHQVRIIGGQWKRSPLTVIEAEGLRPTPDRVRETVFNWLTHLYNGQWQHLKCLDLFAGSGALGFEAASRGANHVTMVETQAAPFQQIQATIQKLAAQNVSAVRSEARQFLAKMVGKTTVNSLIDAEKYDVIFLDPPFGQDLLPEILPICYQLLKNTGVLYVEAEYAFNASKSMSWNDDLPWTRNWDIVRADRAGAVYFHLLRKPL